MKIFVITFAVMIFVVSASFITKEISKYDSFESMMAWAPFNLIHKIRFAALTIIFSVFIFHFAFFLP